MHTNPDPSYKWSVVLNHIGTLMFYDWELLVHEICYINVDVGIKFVFKLIPWVWKCLKGKAF